ncbi:MAG: arginase family protein [Streptosporangiaceae bacterium]
MMRQGLELIGIPANSSGTADGVARAPAALRAHGLAAALTGRPGSVDGGDLLVEFRQPRRAASGLIAEDALVAMIGQLDAAVRSARARGKFPLLIGGDCPVILGALAALQAGQAQPGLLFVDGHEDAWPPAASPTGEAADSELGLALRLFDVGVSPQLREILPRVRPEHVVAIGPRDQEELAAAGIPTLAGQLRALIRPDELDATDCAATAAATAQLLPAPWWLHVDLDVLASASLAAVDYPQPGGLSWDQLSQITAAALAADGCAGWSVCIYNPDLDPDGQSAADIVSYIKQAVATAHRR